ncbi:MAG: secondary thiamine-phosphate synthase enzyme YjbQ [Pseudomonadota bacterium]|jgi:secondary thiamine-phosphate synthase enzyme|nr:secondary thiamine-phosphate synthase enzyme YjbQ [Pseudomonadota bacterium]|tara:strand:- start:13468 stop:13890 length:423 start_codon:yes stop_codon:yes gene_type:complete
MPVITEKFSLDMQGNDEITNITKKISDILSTVEIKNGTATIFVKHTTASLMIFEDEPGLRKDTKSIWKNLIPANKEWQHNVLNSGENNGHSHLRGQIQGQSLTIPFLEKKLTLGAWQQVVIIDFDTRARIREIIVQIIGE